MVEGIWVGPDDRAEMEEALSDRRHERCRLELGGFRGVVVRVPGKAGMGRVRRCSECRLSEQ